MAAKKKPKADPYAPYRRQATDAADLRYGQEAEALRMLADSAKGTYLQGRSQANSAAQSIIAAANSSQPKLADLLTRVGQYSGATTSQLAPAPGSGLSREATVQATNLGLTAQSAMAQLEKEKTRAAQAASYQGQKLTDDYRSDIGKIQDRGQSLSKEYGTYASDTLSKLLDAKADRSLEYTKMRKTANNATQSNLTQLLSAGLNPDGTVRKGGSKDPDIIGAQEAAKQAAKPKDPAKAPKPAAGTAGAASQSDVSRFNKTLTSARDTARSLLVADVQSGKLSSDAAIQILTHGAKKGNTTIKPLNDPLAARAALELELHGAVSHNTAQQIHREGIKVRDIGAKVISQRAIQARVEERKRKIKADRNPIKDFYDHLNGK